METILKNDQFEMILSKNRIARELRTLYHFKNEQVPEYIKHDFDEIEKHTGTANQPTAREILESNLNV
jgi:hypothetical protein